MRIGISEIIIVIILAVALISPDRLKDYMAFFKNTIGQINEARNVINSELQEEKKMAEELKETVIHE